MKDYMKDNQWSEIYAFLWYNDDEIWTYTQEDWDNKVREFHEDGVTTVITFSVTHFRISYYPYWNEINETLRKMANACHKYGIKLVEHHSAHLTSRLTTEKGWLRFLENMRVRKGSLDNWKKILPYLTCSRVVNGKKLDDMCQIDGRTGEISDNCYGTYSLCFNNPDYREMYFNYMKDVVAAGIDGIMNDDIQYFGDENACTCEHCRRLFKEETGYELPNPEQWSEFFENYDNPAYIAWKKFKFDSTARMYRDLTKLYDELGVKLLRPNYSSRVLIINKTNYSFERCMDLWSMMMQENCLSTIDKQSYMDYYVEAVHRYAAGNRYGVPSMSVFYPENENYVYFDWALARSWGQLFTGTYTESDSAIERPYRSFERRNIRYYTALDKISDVSFYFSMKSRDFVPDVMDDMFKATGQLQAAYTSGLGVDMVFESDSADELLKHGTVVASYVAMVDDAELLRFAEFVRRGGRLVIFGDFARLNDDGSCRTEAEIEAAFGVKLANDIAVKCGDGEIWKMTFEPENEYQPSVWAEHTDEIVKPCDAVVSKWKLQNEGTGAILNSIVGEPKISLRGENERVIISGYNVDNAIALHIINLSDTIPEEPCKVAHEDEIKNFTPLGEKLSEMTITLKLECAEQIKGAVLKTPEAENEIVLDVKKCGEVAHITVPGNVFSGYGLVAVEL